MERGLPVWIYLELCHTLRVTLHAGAPNAIANSTVLFAIFGPPSMYGWSGGLVMTSSSSNHIFSRMRILPAAYRRNAVRQGCSSASGVQTPASQSRELASVRGVCRTPPPKPKWFRWISPFAIMGCRVLSFGGASCPMLPVCSCTNIIKR